MKGSVKAHISLLLAASMWGLMSPVGKAAMEAGITGLTLANMRMIGAAVCFLDYLFLRKAGEGQSARFADAVLCFFVRDCLQSGMFYFRLVTDLSGRCVYHDYYHADCNHDFSGSFPERTRYSEKW